jgi:hypothetical protein
VISVHDVDDLVDDLRAARVAGAPGGVTTLVNCMNAWITEW